MQDASNQLGAAALDLIQTTMPVFNAPWHVKEALEAAGVPQLTSTTPSRLRSATSSLMDGSPEVLVFHLTCFASGLSSRLHGPLPTQRSL